jgi:hypothetical protein
MAASVYRSHMDVVVGVLVVVGLVALVLVAGQLSGRPSFKARYDPPDPRAKGDRGLAIRPGGYLPPSASRRHDTS